MVEREKKENTISSKWFFAKANGIVPTPSTTGTYMIGEIIPKDNVFTADSGKVTVQGAAFTTGALYKLRKYDATALSLTDVYAPAESATEITMTGISDQYIVDPNVVALRTGYYKF